MLATILCFLFISLPKWAGAIWALFSAQPLIPVLWAKLGNPLMPTFSALWITIPLGLIVLGLIFWQTRKNRVNQLKVKPHVIPTKYDKAGADKTGIEAGKADAEVEAESKPSPPSSEDYWREAEQRFDRINGEVQAMWNLFEGGHVEWIVYARDDRNGRRVERFLGEARRLGHVVSRLSLARKFPSALFTDDADHWLNIIGAIVKPSSIAGDGIDQRGKYEWGEIDDLVDASKVSCIKLASVVSSR